MSKITANELRDPDRVNLWEVVPLPAPFVVYLEPTNLCNFRCTYCPTGHKHLRRQRPNGSMSLSAFKNIIDGFSELPPVRRFNLYKDGEPLVNDAFPDMVEYLHKSGATEQIWTKTNGALLSPERNKRLAEIPLDMLGISIVGVNNGQYRALCDVHIDYSELVDNIADLYSRTGDLQIYISIRDANLTDEEVAKFYADFEPISDFCAVEGLHGWSDSAVMDFRLGTDNSFDGTEIVERQVCPLTLCALGINWNGTVSPCNEDWKHGALVGDLNTQTVADVWHSQKLHDFRMMHLEGRRAENEMCGNCHYMTCLPDNVDGHIDEIIGRLNDETK